MMTQLHNLATTISPAMVLSHVDPAPKRVSLWDCGWRPSQIAKAILPALQREDDGRIWPNPDDEWTCREWGMSPWFLKQRLEWIDSLKQLSLSSPEIDSDPRTGIQRVLNGVEQWVLRWLEGLGGRVTVSISNYDADTTRLVVYLDGEPVGELS